MSEAEKKKAGDLARILSNLGESGQSAVPTYARGVSDGYRAAKKEWDDNDDSQPGAAP